MSWNSAYLNLILICISFFSIFLSFFTLHTFIVITVFIIHGGSFGYVCACVKHTQVPASEPEPVYYQHENHTLLSMTTTETPIQQQKPCKWTCELTNDRGYVVYSALGSFYIPMFVMLFFYWRIYRAAVRTTRAINQGFKTTKGKIYTNVLSLPLSLTHSVSLSMHIHITFL